MDKKITGVVGYITWIGWLIAYLLGDKEGAKFHLNQGAVLALAEIIVSAAAWFIGKIPIIGFLCGILCRFLQTHFPLLFPGMCSYSTKEKQQKF